MAHTPDPARYDQANYRRCGHSGVLLPRLALGLWHNFGGVDEYAAGRERVLHAFDRGITHFDLANNYGPPPGSAEANFGRMLREDLAAYRDELIISTKAGNRMWPGPCGTGGSRKSLLASLDQSLRRMGLDYVDIFYSHVPDPDTPLEETLGALAHAVKSGKALYAGISNYNPEQTARAAAGLRALGTPCLIHQLPYNLLDRSVEEGLLATLHRERIGCIAFCPLAQGLLTNRYLDGVPTDSRVAKEHGFLKRETVERNLPGLRELSTIAAARGQSLAQMALAWVLRRGEVTTALIGASSTAQIDDNLGALHMPDFTDEELARIDAALQR